MKKQVLFIVMVLLGMTSATTTAGNAVANGEDFNSTTRYRFAEPIVFVERGVEFLIFSDGSFDFNTNYEHNFQSTYYRNPTNRRRSVNTTYGAPGTVHRVHYSASRTRGVLITHDRDGKVRRIGNVFINYNRHGKIKRAGSVYMNYQHGNGRLKQVGGLRINYNRWGEIVHLSGIVNQHNAQLNCGTSSNFGTHHDDYNDDFDDDEDYYYYRKDGKVKKQKKNKRN